MPSPDLDADVRRKAGLVWWVQGALIALGVSAVALVLLLVPATGPYPLELWAGSLAAFLFLDVVVIVALTGLLWRWWYPSGATRRWRDAALFILLVLGTAV